MQDGKQHPDVAVGGGAVITQACLLSTGAGVWQCQSALSHMVEEVLCIQRRAQSSMVPAQGVLVTLAIGLHNVPEGLAVASVLVARGVSARQALLWTLVTSAPQPLVALPAFLFVDAFTALLPVALGFAAGCMVWMVFAELLPDALEDAPHPWVRRIPEHSPVFAAFLSCLRHCATWPAVQTRRKGTEHCAGGHCCDIRSGGIGGAAHAAGYI